MKALVFHGRGGISLEDVRDCAVHVVRGTQPPAA